MTGYLLLDPDGASWWVQRTPRKWKPPNQHRPPVVRISTMSAGGRWFVYRDRAAALRDLKELRGVRLHQVNLEIGAPEEVEATA